MDRNPSSTDDPNSMPLTTGDLDSISEPSRPYIGNWHAVVSQTNWEKGSIILQWRLKLADSGVASRLYSDPAWSRLVGEVTPQHVGRLRRVSERFGDVQPDYRGLYWSHFLAALDWNDAEMWLEGAVQNNWSVSKMRFQRWEAMGAVAEHRPDPLEIVSSPDEEGVRIPAVTVTADQIVRRDEFQSTQGPSFEGPDFGDDDRVSGAATTAERGAGEDRAFSGNQIDIQATLDQLPKEISRPFIQLRDAIVRQNDNDWKSVKRIHVVALINDLRQLLRKPPAAEA